MAEDKLFTVYQNMLAWIDRRLEPKSLEVYQENAEAWKHAKEVAFTMYQDLRQYPELTKCIFYDKELVEGIPDYEDKFPAIGILKYRDEEFTIYTDDYGMQDFIVVDDHTISIDSFGGGYDWWYELDRIIDRIY